MSLYHMKKFLTFMLFAGALAALGGCVQAWQNWQLRQYDAAIRQAERAVKTASGDRPLALAYSELGRAYSEKARYSRGFKLLTGAEYESIFALGEKAHDAAVALAPGEADVFLKRGLSEYDRAAALGASKEDAAFLEKAEADFTSAIKLDPSKEQALDMRGLIYMGKRDYDKAIDDFTREKALDQRGGTLRLAEAYCARGSLRQGNKDNSGAAADYLRTIEFEKGTGRDACDCDPYAPLAGIYYEQKDYAKSWETVNAAKTAGSYIPPEFLADLKKASGRER